MRLNRGFTLIELLVGITLGSVVVAIAVSLYASVNKSYLIQEGNVSIQSNLDIAFTKLTDVVKKAVSSSSATDIVTGAKMNSGLILNANAFGYSAAIPLKYISQTGTGSSIVNKPSDQLVVKYVLPTVVGNDLTPTYRDCEGRVIALNATVIERYFVRQSSENSSNLVLACDAGRVDTTTNTITDMDDLGTPLIDSVGYFRVLLSVLKDGRFQDVPIDTYNTSFQSDQIVGVSFGLMVRSNKGVGAVGMKDLSKVFRILDQDVTLNSGTSDSANKYIYETMAQTVSTRFASGPIK